MTKQPNFLFIITDQQRAADLGCYGHKILETPNVDGLAARGTRFDRFYVSAPICQPNRSTLMTGRMPSLHGVRHNGISLSTNETTFIEVLRDAGYRTASVGKSHLQNITMVPPALKRPPPRDGYREPAAALQEARKTTPGEGPYDQELSDNWLPGRNSPMSLPFYGFDHVELADNHGDVAQGHFDHWQRERHADAENLRGPQNALPHDYVCPQAWRTAVPEELYSTAYVEERTCAYLDAHAAQHSDQPFFLFTSFPDPHHPFTPPGKYWDLYKPGDVELPASFPLDGKPALDMAAWLYENLGPGTPRDNPSVAAVNEREAREMVALTYGMIAMIDDAIGRILAHLESLGLADDTVIVFTSDHGDYQGAHGMMAKGPIHLDGLIRVPFIWVDPRTEGTAPQTSALSSTLDIARTILDRARIEPYNGIQGHSLLDLVSGEKETVRDSVLIEEAGQRTYLGLDGPTKLRTIVTDRHRLTIYHGRALGQMYDLAEDPDEMVNLWDDPSQLAVKAELLERLARLQLEHGELSRLPTHTA